MGVWQDQPSATNTRPTWARCKVTPKRRRIKMAIRPVVHRSVGKPHAMAPCPASAGGAQRHRTSSPPFQVLGTAVWSHTPSYSTTTYGILGRDWLSRAERGDPAAQDQLGGTECLHQC